MSRTILILEDDRITIRAFNRIVNDLGAVILPTGCPDQAVRFCRHRDVSLVIVNGHRHGLDGARKLLTRLYEASPGTTQLLLLEQDELDCFTATPHPVTVFVNSWSSGSLHDLIAEQVCKEPVSTRPGPDRDLANLVPRYQREIHRVLPQIADRGHRVRTLAANVCRLLGADAEVSLEIESAAAIFQLGLTRVTPSIARKPERLLTEDERVVFFEYPMLGARVVAADGMQRISRILAYQREDYCGTGFPFGAAHRQIPLGARILRIAIDLEEFTEHFGSDLALKRIVAGSGRAYDPGLVQLMVDADAGVTTRVPLLCDVSESNSALQHTERVAA